MDLASWIDRRRRDTRRTRRKTETQRQLVATALPLCRLFAAAPAICRSAMQNGCREPARLPPLTAGRPAVGQRPFVLHADTPPARAAASTPPANVTRRHPRTTQ